MKGIASFGPLFSLGSHCGRSSLAFWPDYFAELSTRSDLETRKSKALRINREDHRDSCPRPCRSHHGNCDFAIHWMKHRLEIRLRGLHRKSTATRWATRYLSVIETDRLERDQRQGSGIHDHQSCQFSEVGVHPRFVCPCQFPDPHSSVVGSIAFQKPGFFERECPGIQINKTLWSFGCHGWLVHPCRVARA